MKPLLLTILALSPFPALTADTPSSGRGFFGFGSSKPKEEQISGGLFPSNTSTIPASPVSSYPSNDTAEGESIFREGEPQKVEPVSYVIENGQKVEVSAEAAAETKKKSSLSLFSFGKGNEEKPEAGEALSPVPVQAAPVAATPLPPASPTLNTPPAPVASPVPAPVASPVAPAEAKESRFGWIPFLSKKKEENPTFVNTPPPVVPVSPSVATPVPAPSNPPAVAAETTTGDSEAKPETPEGTVASFEVPRADSSATDFKKEEKSGESEGGLLSPITKILPAKKEKVIDLSSAETIIQDGEIVAGSDTTFEAAPSTPESDEKRPPQVVNGVKTYSSWGDVEGRSTSAADRILSKMR